MFTLWHCTEADLILQLLQLANNQSQGQTLAASVYNHPVQNWQCNAVIQAGNCLCPVIFYMVSYIMFAIIILEAPLRTTLRGKKKTTAVSPHLSFCCLYIQSLPMRSKSCKSVSFWYYFLLFLFLCLCLYLFIQRQKKFS